MPFDLKPISATVGKAVCAATLLFAGNAAAELIVGLTTQNALITFDSTAPGTVTVPVPISGLAAGSVLQGIDRRPSLGPNNGLLYGFAQATGTGAGQIYTINTGTGLATLVSNLGADPADTTAPFPYTTTAGTAFGVDFNPTVDRLRVTSNLGQNLRINVDNGLTQLDVPLAYALGDTNAGDVPSETAVAYSNNFGGATSTVLRGVDSGQSPDLLVIHTNPNGGTLTTSLDLPFDLGNISYDISGLTGTPYFSALSPTGGGSQFYAATAAGVTLVGLIGGGVSLVGIAAPVGFVPTQVSEPGILALLGIALAAFGAARRRRASQ